ncbi:MAG: hypothetical protein V4472_23095 [Pseudomonadota bacterium]
MTGSPIKRYSFTWPPRSLVWQGDELVDRIGAARWLEDGSPIMLGGRFPYTFDRALASPSGLYGALYAERQTKGLLVDDGSMLREIDRSYCHADDYAYPIALGRLCDGREVIAHCPKAYGRLEIDTLDKGKRLTRRRGKSQDIFHSRLSFSPDGRFLLSAGWVWHPWNGFCIFDVARALEDPRSLDREEGPFGAMQPSVTRGEVYAACWLDAERVLVTTDLRDLDHDEDEPTPASGIWSVPDGAWISQSTAWNPQASLFSCAGGVLYVENGHPHWWAPGMEAPLAWPDIAVVAAPGAESRNGIVHDCPLLAVHPTAPRFAAVTAEAILVVDLGDR